MVKYASPMQVVSLIKEREGAEGEVVKGVHVKDVLTGEEWDVRAKVVINATG